MQNGRENRPLHRKLEAPRRRKIAQDRSHAQLIPESLEHQHRPDSFALGRLLFASGRQRRGMHRILRRRIDDAVDLTGSLQHVESPKCSDRPLTNLLADAFVSQEVFLHYKSHIGAGIRARPPQKKNQPQTVENGLDKALPDHYIIF